MISGFLANLATVAGEDNLLGLKRQAIACLTRDAEPDQPDGFLITASARSRHPAD